ncbi:FGGY-family carbohydrate kinase [Actinomycetospora sp. CA-101289]|uniref:FGGY-family carbohydrate kinase n=1 Tax=Actinomycetospora sp. CA-101289 TaxID=3239893 RepID=UPI003D953437
MDGRTWIGIDLGTQSVRALAVADDGTVRAAATRPLHSRHPATTDGEVRHEQDPGEWTAAVDAALAEVVAGVDPAAVGGLAVDATSGTVVLTSEDGPLTPGVMYDDARGSPHVERVREVGAEVWDRLGYRVGASWALPTVLALLEEHPGARVRHQTDVVTAHLVGHDVPTDTSTALKTGYDLLADRWPAEVLTALGIDPGALPAVVPSGRTLGGLGRDAAAATGLRPGTPVLAGTTDGCAAQFGAGAVRPGDWNAVLGTTLVLKGVADRLLHDPAGTVYCHRDPQGGWWLPGGASSTGAAVLAQHVEPARFDVHTRALAAGGTGDLPVVYPLAGTGERFPFAAPDAEGFWLDGDRARPLAELAGARGERTAFAALAEGVAFVERLCFEHVAGLGADVSGPRTITGGATRNPWWNQHRADVLGVALHRPDQAEPALGTAMLARAGVAAGDGEPDLVAVAGEMVHVAEVLAPRHDPAIEERYAAFRAALAERGWIGPPGEDT